ncbi:MAG: hypothetical protein HDQ93_02255 [Desulfovibrio sp.]|nr:hypothetical protein [Desulfovibrio sp.]
MSENLILSVIFFVIIVSAFILWKYGKSRKASGAQTQFIRETLELARSQFEIFNVKLRDSDAKSGLAAILHDMGKNGLRMEVGDYVSEEWNGAEVNAYFKVIREDDPVFYVFSSRVLQLSSDYEASSLVLKTPDHLQVEKKRHFIRVSPDKGDVKALGVWPLPPGKRLPRTSDEIGVPLSIYKPGMKEESIKLVNISGAGLALEIRDIDDATSANLSRGKQILCLVGYNLNNKYAAFWCTGEIMNVRENDSGGKKSVFIGIEFINWASLEEGHGEIHWSHSSPFRGAKPMLQWVDQIERSKKK